MYTFGCIAIKRMPIWLAGSERYPALYTREIDTFGDIDLSILTVIIVFVLFGALGVAVHELGHLVCGLATGYRFQTLRLFWFVWTKKNGKISLQVSKGVSLGECGMIPPDDERKFRFVLYYLGGCLFNLISAALLVAAMCVFSVDVELWSLYFTGIFVNVYLAASSLLPRGTQIPNDGMNLMTAAQSDDARHGLFIQLHMSGEMTCGKRLREYGDDVFAVRDTADIGNYFVANSVICEAGRLYDLGEYDKSAGQLERLNCDRLHRFNRPSVISDLLYYYIVHRPDYQKAQELYKSEGVAGYLKLNQISARRIMAAYSYFVKNDEQRGRKLLEEAKAAAERQLENGFAMMESDCCVKLEELMDSRLPAGGVPGKAAE